MAKASARTEHERVEKVTYEDVAVRKVTLEMSEEEAQMLRHFLGVFPCDTVEGLGSESRRRGHLSNIHSALWDSLGGNTYNHELGRRLSQNISAYVRKRVY